MCGRPSNLTGKIIDRAGQPVDKATVLIYHAGVKKGYSTFCPSCYLIAEREPPPVPTEPSESRVLIPTFCSSYSPSAKDFSLHLSKPSTL